jgi:uncharacterized membrane protein
MHNRLLFTLLLPFWLFVQPLADLDSEGPVVRAVLFYSPECGHCHIVISETLLPMIEQYGEQLYIVGVDISNQNGYMLFRNVLQHFGLDSGGVPFLVVGDTFLVGSLDIPEKFPGLVEQYLADGGSDWPAIPGLAEAMAPAETEQEQAAPTSKDPAPAPEETAPAPEETTITPVPPAPPAATPTPAGLALSDIEPTGLGERLGRDPLGNGLAIVVLIGMLLSAIGGVFTFQRLPNTSMTQTWSWLIPLLCLVGLVVAGYLAYVETTHVEAVCGPVGDCNTVQQSEYARLFGVLPLGIVGLVGYVMILAAWLIGRNSSQLKAAYAWLALFGMSAFGVLFSIYLTFLEPFVIGATCAWCLTSAILMTALFWLSLAPARSALTFLHKEKKAFKRSGSKRAL